MQKPIRTLFITKTGDVTAETLAESLQFGDREVTIHCIHNVVPALKKIRATRFPYDVVVLIDPYDPAFHQGQAHGCKLLPSGHTTGEKLAMEAAVRTKKVRCIVVKSGENTVPSTYFPADKFPNVSFLAGSIQQTDWRKVIADALQLPVDSALQPAEA